PSGHAARGRVPRRRRSDPGAFPGHGARTACRRHGRARGRHLPCGSVFQPRRTLAWWTHAVGARRRTRLGAAESVAADGTDGAAGAGWLTGEWVVAIERQESLRAYQVIPAGIMLLALTYFTAGSQKQAVRRTLVWLGGMALLPAALALGFAAA